MKRKSLMILTTIALAGGTLPLIPMNMASAEVYLNSERPVIAEDDAKKVNEAYEKYLKEVNDIHNAAVNAIKAIDIQHPEAFNFTMEHLTFEHNLVLENLKDAKLTSGDLTSFEEKATPIVNMQKMTLTAPLAGYIFERPLLPNVDSIPESRRQEALKAINSFDSDGWKIDEGATEFPVMPDTTEGALKYIETYKQALVRLNSIRVGYTLEPKVSPITVNPGEVPNPLDGISNLANLPWQTKVVWENPANLDVSDSAAGSTKEYVAVVTYPGGAIFKVSVPITVAAKVAQPQEKDQIAEEVSTTSQMSHLPSTADASVLQLFISLSAAALAALALVVARLKFSKEL